MIGQIISKSSSKDDMSPKFTSYKNTQEKKFLDFTSENKECYYEPFTFDVLLQSLNNSHDTAVHPDQIHYQILKLCKYHIKFGKVVISRCPGRVF